MTRFIEHLDNAIQSYADSLSVKTRNEKNEILKFQGTTYFSIVYKLREKPVITAGALEHNPKKDRVPAMRFRDNNLALASISGGSKFAYRKSNWTNVEIKTETIDLFPQLLKTEIDNFFSKLNSPRPVPSSLPAESKEGYGPIFASVLGLIWLIAGIYSDSLFFVVGGVLTVLVAFVVLMIGLSSGRYTVPESTPATNSVIGGSDSSSQVRCARCGSSQITAQKRGFRVGRAIGAGIATGAIGGLVAGVAGKNKVVITCLKCGHEWRP
jgi:hypothetical protein